MVKQAFLKVTLVTPFKNPLILPVFPRTRAKAAVISHEECQRGLPRAVSFSLPHTAPFPWPEQAP